MLYKDVKEIKASLNGILTLDGEKIKIADSDKFNQKTIDEIVYNAVFGDQEIREICRWVIWECSQQLAIYPSSIQGLYEARAHGEYSNITVPASNIRGMTYDTARALFRAAIKNNVKAFIFEIARSEIGYTDQKPSEYTAVVLGAALKEGYKGPVFIQGDHYQVSASKFSKDSAAEIKTLKDLIKESVDSGFYNIDIDASTLVDLSKNSVREQQRLNYEVTAELSAFIRSIEPEGITVSVGGEIGEVGKKNSTIEELKEFLKGFREELGKKGETLKGLSKISVQTGTTHGGVPLPDGKIAEVKLDFNVLKDLSKAGREEFSIGGTVQHGASTLPEEAFDKFPQFDTVEVHLATGFQNIIYDSSYFPQSLREEIYGYIRNELKGEKKDSDSEEQFIYKTRKKGFGPFKKKMWDMPEDIRKKISEELEQKFNLLFKKLNVANTKKLVEDKVKVKPVKIKIPQEIKKL